MRIIYFLKGLPASGKSTWARQKVLEDKGRCKRINKDDLANMIDNGVYNKENRAFVIGMHALLIRKALLNDNNVVVDDTNLSSSHYKNVCDIAERVGDVLILEKSFNTPLEVCIERDSKREACVGEEVIREFHKRYGLKNGFGVDRIRYFAPKKFSKYHNMPQDKTLKQAVICDVDGTISLFNQRDKFGNMVEKHKGVHFRSPYDASTSDKDAVNEPVLEVLKMCANNDWEIIFVSGRDEKYKEPTVAFLNKHLLPIKYKLFMRADGDTRKDSIIKKEIFEGKIYGYYYIRFVLDDRNQTVNCWRDLGLPCFQVAEGDF